MAKKSDYNDPRTNLFERLPEVFRSQTNEAVFENVFNRFLSKPQIELVDGFAGEGFNNANQDRQIVEPTPHRQAFQLQPLMYAKVGSTNHMASYVDVLNEISRYGIDDCRLPLWGNTLQFNWAPPIDIDKLVNFRDYYWYDVDDPTSSPQYITIESPCIKAGQRAEAYEETITTFGDLQPVVGLNSSNQTFTVAGDLSAVFTDGFVFFVTGSTNTAINLTYWTTASSTYSATLDLTIITVDEAITDDSTVDGNITLELYLSVLQSEQQCACGDDIGWDSAPWDDNQVGAVLWSTGLLATISWATEAEWITANTPGSPGTIEDLSIWYDTTDNQLKQYYSGAWTIIQNNFAAIVSQQEGTHFWDYTSTCDTQSNPWTDQNKWYHKNHVPNFSIAKKATLPIIEYEFTAQLNRWTFTDYVWKYRESDSFSFATTDIRPTLNELIPFSYVIDPGLQTITVSPAFGDLTSVFVPGYQFQIQNDGLDVGNNGTYTVATISYTTTTTTPGDENATVIVIEETFSSANQSETSVSTSPTIVGSGGEMTPRLTSVGDFFLSYNEHWLLDDAVPGIEPATGKLLPVASPPPTVNPQAELDPLSIPVTVPGIGEYLTSAPVDLSASYGVEPYVLTMEYTVLPTIAPAGVVAGTVIPLDPRMIGRAPMDETVVRVVYNGQQVYGTFTELDTGIGGSPLFVGSPAAFGSPLSGVNDGFVDSITLAFDLGVFDTLRITVAEQSVEDIGRAAVAVRTVENDSAFAATGSPLGSQPEVVSLIQYRHIDPLKTLTNEYPLFDLFDCEGGTLNLASSLFKWRESQTASINTAIGLRIVGTTTADYEFENLLIDSTTLTRPVLYTYASSGSSQSVWRKGLNDEEYVPSYVDKDRNPISVGDPLGAWEIPNQLYYNAEHENRQYVSFPDVITHFRSILDEQIDFPGVILSGSQAYLQERYNFGLGGRIKEHNDSYDTFLSSVFVNNVSPPGIIDFAHDQYENSLNTIKELYRRNLLSFLTDSTTSAILDLQTTIDTNVINTYELNDFFALVYGDSNTYIAGVPELGVKNWPATLPFVGLGFKELPYIIQDDTQGLLQLVHHDGHRSTPSITASTRESVIQTLLNTSDSRVPGEKWGTQQNTLYPDTYSELESFITPRPGVYWYSIVSGVRALYRFVVSAVAATAPSGVSVGSLWYDTSTDLLRELQTDLVSWDPVEVGSPSVGIITQAWQEVDFNEMLVNLLHEVETRLYEAAPTLTELDFDVNSILTSDISCSTSDPTITEADTANTYYQEAFSTFLRDVDIDDPYSADQYYVATDPFTWNYSFSTITTRPASGSPQGTGTGGWWTTVYQNLYGTPYPHLEPWALQGYTSKPSWWDSEYLNDDLDIYGTRRWKHLHGTGSPLPEGMWEEIRVGRVPSGFTLPDGTTSTGVAGEVQTWNYFSVNIADSTIDGFEPDDLFPPFWDYTTSGGSSLIRSAFSSFAGEIVLPSADYTFTSGGPITFLWENSSQKNYDDLLVGFRMQPVRFIHSTLGVNFIDVAGLQVNEADCKVYSHRDVTFHGDIVNTNELLQVDGINQWYVNFNRFNGYDVASSDFRTLWGSWEPLLTYQFASIIDTETLQITNSNFDITERDYNILLKKSPGIDDFFLDAFNVTVLESPNKLARYDTQSLWKFQLDTFFPTTRSLSYYEVHNYPVRVDTLTDTVNLYQYDIASVDTAANMFFLNGDQTDAFTTSQTFSIIGSTGNNGTYTATNVAFSVVTNQTVITVASVIDPTVDGFLVASYRTHPWSTGDKIELTATQAVPAPLTASKEYYVIKIDGVTFQLASTLADATAGRNIILSSDGAGQVYAGQVYSKFVALEGKATSRTWNHYLIDTRYTRQVVTPQRVTGVQTLINLIDGYAVVQSEAGWIVNLENFAQDPASGQPITWALETERFIDQAFRLPQQRATLPNTYPTSVDPIADTLTFNNTAPVWTTGTKVSVTAGNGVLPAPLLANSTYYAINVDDSTIKLALTSTNALLEQAIDIISGGSATISVFETPTPSTRHPSIEINPFRNNIWLNTPQGVLSNIVDGPTQDIRNTQLVTDQYGNQLTGEDISVFRWDKLARVYVPTPIPNSAVATKDKTSYNTIHMASIQAFVDGYEGVILFNDYAVDGTLVYDPFIGLNTQRFNLQFFRQDEFTQRPVVGGYFLTPDDQILRNIESSVLDLQNLYDTHRVLETTESIREGRKTINYRESDLSFLDEIGLNPKSKFLFWKGMIQNKGSVKAVEAFTNSAKFENAIVDEYWAYKVANFGTNYEQEYPALNLVIADSRRSEKRLEFLTTGETASNTFEGVLLTNTDRWYNQPDVLRDLQNNNSSFYFDTEVSSVEAFTIGAAGAGSPTLYYLETETPFDDVVALNINTNSDTLVSTLVEGTDYTIINSRLIELNSNVNTILAPTPFVIAQTRADSGGSPLYTLRQYTSDDDVTTWSTKEIDQMGDRLGIEYDGVSRWVSIGFGNYAGAFSPQGAFGSPTLYLFTSDDDGATWDAQSTPASFSSFLGIAYGNGTWVVVGSGGVITSTDGETWTERTATTSLNDIVWTGTQFFATAPNEIAYSSDGISWTVKNIASVSIYSFNAVTANGSRWFAGTTGVGRVYYSDDSGDTWTLGTGSSLGDRLDSMASNGNNIVATGLCLGASANTIFSLDNGVTWTAVDLSLGSPQLATWLPEVKYVPGYGFIAGGYDDSYDAVILTSTDGSSWVKRVDDHVGRPTQGGAVNAIGSKAGTNAFELRLYTVNPAKDNINPSKVIDVKSNIVIAELPLWDPRRGHQYSIANNIVTLAIDTDPATYTDALDTSKIDSQFWNKPEVGEVWWDTNERGYVPYDDTNIFSLNTRIQKWGKLADWSEVKLYQWTESDILPSEWDDTAAVEELDISIDPLIRKTGRAKIETLQRERSTISISQVYPSTTNTGSPMFAANTIVVDDTDGILSLDDRIVFTTDNELPLPLQSGVFYYIVSIDSTVPAFTVITVSLELSGTVLDIKPGAMVVDINGDASVGTNPTGLINDFNTSGVQQVTFTATKSLGSSTGLALGSRGYQEVSFPNGAIAAGSSTGLNSGGGGYQVISGIGSPVTCGATAGLFGPALYTMTGSVDGGAPVIIYLYEAVTNTSTFSSIAGTIGAYLAGATATCDPGSNGIIVQSNSVGPGSSISLTDLTLVAAMGGSIDSAVAGSVATTYEATVTVDGGDQTLIISGDTSQTFGTLVQAMNNQLSGSSTSIVAGNLRVTSNSTGTGSTISITDVDIFSSTCFGVGSPCAGNIEDNIPGTSTSYQTNIAVNGGSLQSAIVTGDDAQTFSQLIDRLNQNISGATVSLLSGVLRITSNTSGSNSTIDVIDGGTGSPITPSGLGLLESLRDVETFQGTQPADRRPTTEPVDGTDATRYTTELDFENGLRLITVIGNEAQNWNNLLSRINSQLPIGAISTTTRLSPVQTDLLIDAGNNTVTITNDNLFTRLGESLMGSPLSEDGIYFNQFIPQNTGEGNHTVVPPFRDTDWIQIENITKEMISARDKNNAGQFDLSVTGIAPNSIVAGDSVDVYVNGTLTQSDVTVGTSGLTVITGTDPQDFVVVRKVKHVLTDDESDFDPDVSDDGTNLIQYKEDYNYSTTYRLNSSNVQVPVYHFWVESKTTRSGSNITMRSAETQLETIPTPFMMVDNLLPELFTGSPAVTLAAPRRYTQLILRGLAGVVDDTDRYILRFTRDFTLRDDLIPRNYTTDLTADYLRVGADPLDLKSHHTEWTLIRENQPFNVSRDLWDRVTESMIAEKLDDATTRVPSLSRELYDVTYGTDTRYGLGTEQAFVDGALAKATLIDDLQDPNNDFSPIDINVFFAAHDFDTTAGLTEVMDDIYNSFSYTSVNRIYFKILLDAFTTKQKFEEIFKTSWVALSGTQVFQTEEVYSG